MSSRLFKHQLVLNRKLAPKVLYLAFGNGQVYKVNKDTDSLDLYITVSGISGASKVVFSPDNRHIAYAFAQQQNNVRMARHDGNGNWVNSTLPNFPSPSAEVHSVDWSKDGKYVFFGIRNAPYLVIYRLNADNSFTRMPDLSLNIPSSGYSVQFNPKGDVLAVSSPAAPYIRFYKYDSADGSLTALPNPNVAIGTYSYEGLVWVEDYVLVYAKENATAPDAFRVDLAANTVTTLTTTGFNPGNNWVSGVSPDGKHSIYAQWSGTAITYVRYNGGATQLSFTTLTLPAGLPAGALRGVGFSPDGGYAAFGYSDASPAVLLRRNGDVLTKINVANMPGAAMDAVFSN